MTFIPPRVYPGPLPTHAPPAIGETLMFAVSGLPPYKDESFSIRNVSSAQYIQFMLLRESAATAMNGRWWTDGPVGMDVIIHAPASYRDRHGLLRYVSGIMDSLDGSHGPTFTFLPVVYNDDSLVVASTNEWRVQSKPHYRVAIRFMPKTIAEARDPDAST